MRLTEPFVEYGLTNIESVAYSLAEVLIDRYATAQYSSKDINQVITIPSRCPKTALKKYLAFFKLQSIRFSKKDIQILSSTVLNN